MDGTEKISDVRLLSEIQQPLKQLAGFQKHHRIPQTVGSGDLQFLAEIVQPQLDADLQNVFTALRLAFGFKRKEITVNGPIDGGGMISTPFFNYEITVTFQAENPARIVWRRSISGIRDPHQIFTSPFHQVFGNKFSILEVSTSGGLDLEAIVDHIEDTQQENVSVDYDKDVTWCEIEVARSNTTVKIDADSIRVSSRAEGSPQDLLAAFAEVQQQFIATLNCTDNPFSMDSA